MIYVYFQVLQIKEKKDLLPMNAVLDPVQETT